MVADDGGGVYMRWNQISAHMCPGIEIKGNKLMPPDTAAAIQITGVCIDSCLGAQVVDNLIHTYYLWGIEVRDTDVIDMTGWQITGNEFVQDWGTSTGWAAVNILDLCRKGIITGNTVRNFGQLINTTDESATLYQGRRIVCTNNQVIGCGTNTVGDFCCGLDFLSAINNRGGQTMCIDSEEPTKGTWQQGSVIWNYNANPTDGNFWVCTKSGTFSAFSQTGNTDGATGTITNVPDTSGIAEDDWVTVSAGFPSAIIPYRVVKKTATTITVQVTSNSVQVGVTVATPDPLFVPMGVIP
jgi:hypothetical protein